MRFEAPHRLSWEVFEAPRPGPLAYQLWRPDATMGGTQLMQLGLSGRLGTELDAINLQLHRPDHARLDGRPLVVWIHNDVGEPYRWCADAERMRAVSAMGGTVDSLRVAVLAALNIADELAQMRERVAVLEGSLTQTQGSMRSRAGSLAHALDEVLDDRRVG